MIKAETTANEFEHMPIGRLLIKLMLPSIAAQLVSLLYSIVDRVFIGRIPAVGSTALAGLGIAVPLITVIEAFAMLIGSGGGPLAAIAMGRKDKKEAETIMGNCCYMLLGTAVVLTLVFFFFSKPLLLWLGADGETLPYANTYLKIYVLGTVFVLFSLGLNPFLVTQGFNKISMRNVCIGAVTNIILDPVLIYGFHMGIAGAAVATIVSQGIVAVLTLSFLFGKQTRLQLKKVSVSFRLMKRVVGLGISSFFIFVTEGMLQSVFYKQLLTYGNNDYVTAMSIMFSINQVLVRLCQGISDGAQPILSYNFGAGNQKRFKDTVGLLVGISEGITFVLVTVIMITPAFFIRIFTTDAAIVELGSHCIRIYIVGRAVSGMQLGIQNLFRAIGYAKTAIYNASMRKIVLIIPLALILPGLWDLGTTGVFLAESVSDILATFNTVISYLVLRKGIYRKIQDNTPPQKKQYLCGVKKMKAFSETEIYKG